MDILVQVGLLQMKVLNLHSKEAEDVQKVSNHVNPTGKKVYYLIVSIFPSKFEVKKDNFIVCDIITYEYSPPNNIKETK